MYLSNTVPSKKTFSGQTYRYILGPGLPAGKMQEDRKKDKQTNCGSRTNNWMDEWTKADMQSKQRDG